MRSFLAPLLVFLLAAAGAARADVFSPGDLSQPHQSLDGLSNCTRCHSRAQQLSQEKCLACHGELNKEIGARKGFHGKMAPTELASCQKCHHEHQGRSFALIDWGTKGQSGFEHASTGFALRGKHATVSCTACHDRKHIEDPSVRALLAKEPNRRTFLGLTSACTGCHFDEHRDQLGSECASCHNEKAWKPAQGFDHASTGYPLEGSHKRVACSACHPPEKDTATAKDAFPAPVAWTFAKFGEIPHAACNDCHADPHGGRFAQRCESCHTVAGWMKVRNATSDAAFHDKTRFPLRGKHTEVDCKACHGPFPGQRAKFKGLAFSACTDCHADAHEGQLTRPGKQSGSCERCHSLEGFLPPHYEIADHVRTRFPLEGAHQAVACNACHASQSALEMKVPTRVRRDLQRKHRPEAFSAALFDLFPRAAKCEGCHTDPHGGQFAGRADGCLTCHQVESFHRLKFQHDKDTRFPLVGKHGQVACASCHAPTLIKGRSVIQYRGAPTGCPGCHEDVHAGQLASSGASDCARCHTPAAFLPSTFKHVAPFTDFLLEGKHAAVSCNQCHPRIQVARGISVQRFKPLPRECEGCHVDAHHGAFQGLQP